MRLKSLRVSATPPLQHVEDADLLDTVVLAGPNGVGKSRLLEALLACFRNPGANPGAALSVEATCPEERAAWGRERLDTTDQAQAAVLRRHLQRNHKRGSLRGGVLHFEASRAFENIQPYQFSWAFNDPFEEAIGWEVSLQPARSRFQDVVNSLYRKIRSQKEEIAKKALTLKREGVDQMPLDFSDPLVRFKDAFMRLLPGKRLAELEEETQRLSYLLDTAPNSPLPIASLSSGEREVVTIVFDFLLRGPQDCIVVFDEPELHLHPELSYRLLRTLRDVGERNQFILSTHSPDIITASLDQTVIFIAPPTSERVNQAIRVRETDEMATVLHKLGQSIGVISLGKKLVLIEGEQTSLDKQVYGSIVAREYGDLVLVPVGGKETIATLLRSLDTVLKKTVWGVDFFMLCDGDSAAAVSAPAVNFEAKSGGRLRLLPRYHLENYFLDHQVWARALGPLEADGSWLRDPSAIRERLREYGRSFVSYAVALRVAHRVRTAVGNLSLMPSGCAGLEADALVAAFRGTGAAELSRVSDNLQGDKIEEVVRAEHGRLVALFDRDDDAWHTEIPGRPVLNRFAGKAGLDVGRMKRLYLREAADDGTDPFSDIRQIFATFAEWSGS